MASTTALATVKNLVNQDAIQKRLSDMLGKNAGSFGNSIVNLVSGTPALQKCDPASIMSSAMRAASVNLAIDPSLGYAAIVPYGGAAQFQMMYRGYIQLAIRSGNYATMHDTEVYRDELKSHNAITGHTTFTDPETWTLRAKKQLKDVVGFYFTFTLVSGFRCEVYMTMPEVMAHAKEFSKAYQYDVSKGKKTSAWSTDPVAMGKKTVIIKGLKRYGIMSIEMQRAFINDNESFEDAHERAQEDIQNSMGKDAIEAELVVDEETGEVSDTPDPDAVPDGEDWDKDV